MRTLQGEDRVSNGLKGIVILLLVVGVGQSFSSVPMVWAQPSYYAQFKDAAGIRPGDKVRIAGVDVGQVTKTEIQGDHILVGFRLGGRRIGKDSRAAIRTETILGRKDVEIEDRGSEMLGANGTLPLGQTTTPYQIYDAFFDVTKAAQGWKLDAVKQALEVLTETVDQTYPHLSPLLEGVQRFSETIGKRDEQITQLLANANKIAAILGNRSEQVNALLVHAQSLLAAVNARGQAITYLLENVSSFSEQVRGFINENPNLNHVLKQLRTISDILQKHKLDLEQNLILLGRFVTSLGEAVASGPFFKVMIVNLLPYQLLQPWVDAAFKKRGIDPENFWRGAGLPAFQWPDPNGVRLPNGAPAPAPVPLEGTPGYPGPAVPPGSPCSYTPPADGIPTAGNPLPCAHLGVGPYGDNPYGPNYEPPNVVTAPANPGGPGYTPGITSAGVPGQVPPDLQGVPVGPVAPGPPGGRTEPVSGPSNPFPPYGVPPANLPGPPPPAGPGPQVPDFPPPGVPVPVNAGGH